MWRPIAVGLLFILMGAAPATRPKVDESTAVGLVASGQELASRGDHRGAIGKYDSAIAKDAKLAEARAFKAASLIALGRLEEAGDELARAGGGDDRHFLVMMVQGRLHVARGEYDPARATYTAAARKSPVDAGMIYADLAAVLAGRKDDALSGRIEAALMAAASAEPPNLDALFNLGQSYVSAGREEGDGYLRRYLELSSKLPEGKRDERKIKLAKQMIRAMEALRGAK